jgi:peptidoglycan/xylan/chitin deacetylase (PgdA/CDA1 family)
MPPLSVPDIASRPTHTAEGRPILYLTFDDGPAPDHTHPILDLLEQHRARATFFVIGGSIEQHPDTLRATAAAGHLIGNHTYSHVALNTLSREAFVDELTRTRQIMLSTAGDLMKPEREVRYMRPPYGEIDENTSVYAADLGYAMVMWDVDPKDWSEPGTTTIVDRILHDLQPGHIILLHDGGGDRSQTVAALATILQTLSPQGYHYAGIDYGQTGSMSG